MQSAAPSERSRSHAEPAILTGARPSASGPIRMLLFRLAGTTSPIWHGRVLPPANRSVSPRSRNRACILHHRPSELYSGMSEPPAIYRAGNVAYVFRHSSGLQFDGDAAPYGSPHPNTTRLSSLATATVLPLRLSRTAQRQRLDLAKYSGATVPELEPAVSPDEPHSTS